ncbi:MAG: acyltransferase family protein [Planctomycetota bacterium]
MDLAGVGLCCGDCRLFLASLNFHSDADFVKPRIKEFLRVPFQVLYAGNDTNAMMQVLRKGLWFAPLGAFLAWACRGIKGKPRPMYLIGFGLFAMLIAGGIELGQLFLPEKIFDLTDFLLTGGAAVIGLAATAMLLTAPEPARDFSRQSDRVIYVPPSRPEDVSPLPKQGDATSTRRAWQTARTTRPASPASAESEIASLFGLRALACIAVFGVHFQQITQLRGTYAGINLERLFANGHTGVCLFFLLSGFLLSLPAWKSPLRPVGNDRWKTYAWRRTVRIAPPYLLCLTILVLATLHFRGFKDLFDSAVHYLFLHNLFEYTFYGINMPFWTLGIQAQFYALMPLALLFLYSFRHRQRDACVLLFVASFAVYLIHASLMTLANATAPWAINPDILRPDGNVLSRSIVAHLPIFLFGIAAGHLWLPLSTHPRARSERWQRSADLVTFGGLAVTLLLLATPLDAVFELPHGRYNYPFVPLLLVAVLLAAPLGRWSRRILDQPAVRLLGVISFGVYIYHLPCLKLTARTFELGGLAPQTYWLPFGVVAFALSLLVSTISYRYFETPLLRRLTGKG